MATGERTFPQTAQGPAMTLVQGQLAVLEAVRAVWNLIGEQHLENFAVVGGAALLLHGANIRTADADLAITPQSLEAFEEAAKHDERFTYIPGLPWEYTSSLDIIVPIDFLDKSGAWGPTSQVTRVQPVRWSSSCDFDGFGIGKGGSMGRAGQGKRSHRF
ncbi:hypothetical protein HOY80DRAFT_998114 [Tuber brumale]|nr:hypothetical protein HOY80DRAFT_998114 [Tuber brumale]